MKPNSGILVGKGDEMWLYNEWHSTVQPWPTLHPSLFDRAVVWLAPATQAIMAFQLIDVSSHHLRWFDTFFDSVAHIFHTQA